MKRVVTAVIFLIAALIVGIASLKAINGSCNELKSSFERIITAANAESADSLKNESENMNRVWEKREMFFHILVDHSEISDLERDIARLKYYVVLLDYAAASETAQACIDDTEHIKRSSSPEISNIF